MDWTKNFGRRPVGRKEVGRKLGKFILAHIFFQIFCKVHLCINMYIKYIYMNIHIYIYILDTIASDFYSTHG